MVTYKVINNLRDPFPVPVEYKTIYANILVVRNAELLNEPLLEAQGTQRGHQPAVAVIPLLHVICRRAVDVEPRAGKDLGDSLGAARGKQRAGRRLYRAVLGVRLCVGQRLQALALAEPEVEFNVKVRIAVFAVCATAVLHNLGHLGAACRSSCLVGRLCILGHWRCAFGRLFGRLGALARDYSGCCDG